MIRVVTPLEMEIIENKLISDDETYKNILNHIGDQIAQIIDNAYSYKAEEGIVGIIGKGVKTLYALKGLISLAKRGWTVSIYFLQKIPQIVQMLEELPNLKINAIFLENDENYDQYDQLLQQHPIWLEAIAETPAEVNDIPLKEALHHILNHKPQWSIPHHIISIDVPSGIDAQNGDSGPLHIHSDMTIAIGAVKLGLMNSSAINLAGEIQIVEYEPFPIPLNPNQSLHEIPSNRWIINTLSTTIPYEFSDKRKILIVDGSISSPSSPVLTASASLCFGYYPIEVAVPSTIYNINAAQPLDVDWLLLPHELGAINEDAIHLIDQSIQNQTIIVFGAGLEVNEVSRKFYIRFFGKDKIKTSAIGLIPHTETETSVEKALPTSLLMMSSLAYKLEGALENDHSPHLPKDSIIFIPKDELFSFKNNESENNENVLKTVSSLENLAQQWQCTLFYLDTPMIITSPNQHTAFIPLRNYNPICSPQIASILLGLSASLLQRKLTAYEAAIISGWILSAAVKKIQIKRGNFISIQPREIINDLPEVIAEMR